MRIDTQHVTEALAALHAATPAQVDTVLWERERTFERAQATSQGLEHKIALGLEGLEARLAASQAEHRAALADMRVLDQVFASRHGWNRAYKVVSSDGHVHRSVTCSTTYATTRFVLLPMVSGKDEAEIVELAGEAACTVCYPSAPVDVRKRKCLLFTQEEIDAKNAKDAEKAAKAAAKAAKAITSPDGTPLFTETTRHIATEVSAQRAYVELTVDATAGYYERMAPEYGRDAEVILIALAHKRGVDVEALRFELTKNVIAKATRDDSPKAVAAAKAARQYYLQRTALKD